MKKKSILNLTLAFAGTLIAMSVSAQAVTSGNDSGLGTLRAQITSAANGGTISIAPSVTMINLDSALTINKSITITGMANGGANTTTITGKELSKVFNIIGGTVTINTVNIIDGLADDGAGITVTNANLVLTGVEFTNCVANGTSGSGGAILVAANSTLVGTDLIFDANIANRAGGAIEVNSVLANALNLTDCIFTDNLAGVSPAVASPGNGGAIHMTGAGGSIITGGSASGNMAALEGGAFWNGTGEMTVDDVTFNLNEAKGDAANEGGGALFNAGGTLNVLNSNISNNKATGISGSGGGILSDIGILTVENTLFDSNTSTRAGGGIEVASSMTNALTLIDCDFIDNTTGNGPASANPGNGGALHITGSGNSSITGGSASGNIAALEGGAFWNGTGEMTVDDVEFDGNQALGLSANEGGGALFNAGGILTVSNSDIKNNTATGTSASGGGILNDMGTLTVTSTSFTGNSASRAGGAIEDNSATGGILTVTDVTATSNVALNAPGNGGAIHITGTGASFISGGSYNKNIAALEGGAIWNGTGEMLVTGVVLDSNTASGANADEGGGALFNAAGTLTVKNSTITNNSADGTSGSGGGILNDKGTLTVDTTTFTGNSAIRAGGAIEEKSNGTSVLTLNEVIVSENTTGANPGNGGGLHVTGANNTFINGGSFTKNSAEKEGGALWNDSGIMTITNAFIDSNIALGAGASSGGAGVFNVSGNINITGSTISNNIASGTSGSGGGLLSKVGTVTIENSIFEDNACNRAGGAIEIIDGMMTLKNSEFFENDCSGLAGTPAPGSGGAIHVTGMTTIVTIDSSYFADNNAALAGGALWNQTGSTMTVSASLIEENEAGNKGGGVYNNGGTINITNSTISGNDALNNGGGISNELGTMSLSYSTISGNSAENNGGGIYNADSISIKSATIHLNEALIGGGIYTASNFIGINSTLISGNVADSSEEISGPIKSLGYNLIENEEEGLFVKTIGDTLNVTPLLEPLMLNGALFVPTHAILVNSAGVNMGDPNDGATDQRGQAVFDFVREIGAFELMNVSVNEIEANNTNVFVVYPNPATGNVTVSIDKGIVGELVIFDLNGKQVQSATVNGIQTVNVSNLETGMYLVKVSTSNGTQTKKLQIK